MKRSTNGWIAFGMLMLSLLPAALSGNSYTVYHPSPVRSEQMAFQSLTRIRTISYHKAIHINSYREFLSVQDNKQIHRSAALFFSCQSGLRYKTAGAIDPVLHRLPYCIKIPSAAGSDGNSH